VLEGNYLDREESLALAIEILSKKTRPDGVFCANDTAAISVLQVANSMGLKVPEDVAIIGFNDDPICEIVVPQLSSMYHPAIRNGKTRSKRYSGSD
jgi:LacI family transcriptional regulator